MIKILAITTDNKMIENIKINDLKSDEIKWYWVDFEDPSEKETLLLHDFFHFHPLAIEDCLNVIQRPKMNHYGDTTFFVLHEMNQESWRSEEVDCFLGANFVVSFHKNPNNLFEKIKKRTNLHKLESVSPLTIVHNMIDEIVDMYFPIMYQIEDKLNEYDGNTGNLTSKKMMDEIYEIRGDLIQLRKTIIPMRDLLYRIINSQRMKNIEQYEYYFSDIYDHLLKLADMVSTNQDITAEMRDNFTSIQSTRMNSIMMVLTIISVLFMPLTFIAGIYGMNFDQMPELHWKYGYYYSLGLMGLITIMMTIWFYKKGWFEK